MLPRLAAFAILLVLGLADRVDAQPRRGPVVVSPDVNADRRVTFRLLAPKADAVSVFSSDLPGAMQPQALKRGDEGVWELTIGPVEPGTYRYLFNLDGVLLCDPRNQFGSESNGNPWSVVTVPGSDFMDVKDVPHGAVAQVTYRSGVLDRTRRMHVYTPPGYESNAEKYPVFYLLHGAGDSDDSWTSVGRANVILDNLIAAKKAKPMIVVMPMGHTGPFSFIMPTAPGRGGVGNAKFEDEFAKDIVPHIEKNYRVQAGRPNRAIAGLSMGGAQTLDIAFAHPHDYSAIGVFSSGLIFRSTADWEKDRKETLSDPAVKDGLKVFWLATGKDDFLIARSRDTVSFFEKNGFKPTFKETTGGHTWINWQKYLHEFAPLLFQ